MMSRHRVARMALRVSARLVVGIATLASAALMTVVPGPAAAEGQNAQGSSTSSSRFSGGDVQGDPNGAIRALGSAEDGDKAGQPTVEVPRLGGGGAQRTGGAPAGTDGGGR